MSSEQDVVLNGVREETVLPDGYAESLDSIPPQVTTLSVQDLTTALPPSCTHLTLREAPDFGWIRFIHTITSLTLTPSVRLTWPSQAELPPTVTVLTANNFDIPDLSVFNMYMSACTLVECETGPWSRFRSAHLLSLCLDLVETEFTNFSLTDLTDLSLIKMAGADLSSISCLPLHRLSLEQTNLPTQVWDRLHSVQELCITDDVVPEMLELRVVKVDLTSVDTSITQWNVALLEELTMSNLELTPSFCAGLYAPTLLYLHLHEVTIERGLINCTPHTVEIIRCTPIHSALKLIGGHVEVATISVDYIMDDDIMRLHHLSELSIDAYITPAAYQLLLSFNIPQLSVNQARICEIDQWDFDDSLYYQIS